MSARQFAGSPPLATRSVGYIFEAPSGAAQRVVERLPVPGTITAVRGYRVGGSAATVNAKVGSNALLPVDLSLGAGSWTTAPSLQNTAAATGSTLEVDIISVTGSPTYIVVKIEYQGA